MGLDFAAGLGSELPHQRVQGGKHVEEVARLGRLVEDRLETRLAAIFDRRGSVGDDKNAERRSGDDDEFVGLQQHVEMPAKRRVAAEDASDGDDETNGEIQDSLRVRTARKNCGSRLTPSCQGEVSPGQAGAAIVRANGRCALQAWRNSVMQNGLYVAISAQVALERRLETIADNIANMNTVGYRATGVSFETEMAEVRRREARLRLVRFGLYVPARRGIGEDRQPARFRCAGRRLVRDSDAARARLYPRRPRPDRRIGNAAHAERRCNPRRRGRANPHRWRGRAVDGLGRRHDQPERTPGRRRSACLRSIRTPP